jgi:hypothetical protein
MYDIIPIQANEVVNDNKIIKISFLILSVFLGEIYNLNKRKNKIKNHKNID